MAETRRTAILNTLGLDVFMLLAAEELCAPEIARRTGLGLGETKSRLRRAFADGLLARRTNPAKPIEYLYRFVREPIEEGRE